MTTDLKLSDRKTNKRLTVHISGFSVYLDLILRLVGGDMLAGRLYVQVNDSSFNKLNIYVLSREVVPPEP